MSNKHKCPTIKYAYSFLKDLAINHPEELNKFIEKHNWHYLSYVVKKDIPKLVLIKDFIKNPSKYENYYQKLAEKHGSQLSLF
jgi:hypothetical protein